MGYPDQRPRTLAGERGRFTSTPSYPIIPDSSRIALARLLPSDLLSLAEHHATAGRHADAIVYHREYHQRHERMWAFVTAWAASCTGGAA